MIMRAQNFIKLAVWIALLGAYYGFNRNVPYILSGVDQIVYPNIMRASFLVIYISLLSYAIHAAVSLRETRSTTRWVVFLATALAVINLVLSIRVYFIDNLDIYLHINDERVIVNLAILIWLTVELSKSKTAEGEDK